MTISRFRLGVCAIYYRAFTRGDGDFESRFRLEPQQLVSRVGARTRASGIAHDVSLSFLNTNNMGDAVNMG